MLSGNAVAKCRCVNNEQCVWVLHGAQRPSQVSHIVIKALGRPVYDVLTNMVCTVNKYNSTIFKDCLHDKQGIIVNAKHKMNLDKGPDFVSIQNAHMFILVLFLRLSIEWQYVFFFLFCRAWQFISQNFRKKGALLVTVPSIQEALMSLQETNVSNMAHCHIYCQHSP